MPDGLINYAGNNVKSLASKTCKFLFDYMYMSPTKNNPYYINDKIIRHTLLYYLDYYNVERTENLNSNEKVDQLSYKELYKLLEKLHKARDEEHKDEITKNELDHIIWYSYKSFF